MPHRIDQYAADVAAGRIVAGPLVRAACERHRADRRRRDWPYRLDFERADHAIRFFEEVLLLPDADDEAGDPRPFLLQPWQAFVVGSVFGWVDRDGRRRYREAYCEVGKGNGKTPLAAGIGLYGLLMDGEGAAEIYSAATDRDQAKICWTDALRMVERSSDLAQIVMRAVNNLAYRPTFSFFRPLSSEHRGLDGKRPHVALIDELHEHPNAHVVNKIRAGAKGRKQPLFFEITNSGFDRTSICWQHHEHSRRVLEGVIQDDRWFAYVCGLDEGDDPLSDEGCWVKTNPNLGVSIQREYLARQVENALNIPAETNLVLRLNFCVWTQANARYFDMRKWRECGNVVVRDEELVGVAGFGGLDLGQSNDFSAFVGLWPLDDGRVAVKARYWLPRATVERKIGRPYAEWERSGRLTVTEGEVVDFDVIEDCVAGLAREWGLLEIAYDKQFAQQMAQHLDGRGLTMVDTPQGFFLNEATRRLAEWVSEGRLAHGGDPILAWMADNAVIRHGRNTAIRLDKDTAAEKIDGIVALAMAASRYVVQPAGGPSVYETRGAIRIGGGA